MSSSPALLSTSTSLSLPAATSSVISNSASQLACQTAIYVVVILVIVAIICGAILLIWNDNWTILIRRMESVRWPQPSASSPVQWMLRYFFKTLVPAIQRLVRVAANPRRQPLLPLFTPPWFREPRLTPRPAMLRDGSSFHVPFNSYLGSNPHRPPPSPPSPAFHTSDGSAPLA